jgi:hypothetical protein
MRCSDGVGVGATVAVGTLVAVGVGG